MTNNLPTEQQSHSSNTFNIPKKRFKPEQPLPSQFLSRNNSTSSYVELDGEYFSNGVNQYTIRFLKKMTESNASIITE